MKIAPQKDVWVTRDSGSIPVCAMSDEHLQNALAWIKRKAERRAEVDIRRAWEGPTGVAAFPSHNAATDAATEYAEALTAKHWTRWAHQTWASMFKECLRRGGALAQHAVDLL